MRTYVLFRSSFRNESAPNISHETVDGALTLCGRRVTDAATVEPDSNDLDPDCRICYRATKQPQLQPRIVDAKMNDADRVRLAISDGARMLGPVERQRCSKHQQRWITYRWAWRKDADISGGDIEVVRQCIACDNASAKTGGL